MLREEQVVNVIQCDFVPENKMNAKPLLTPTNIVLGILIVVVFVFAILLIILFQRTSSNPLSTVPFQATVLNGSLVGGRNGEVGANSSLGIYGKEHLRFGHGISDQKGYYVSQHQSVHLFCLTLMKSQSSDGVTDELIIRQNTGVRSYQLLPKQSGSYSTSICLFCQKGDKISFEYCTGTYTGPTEANSKAITVLNKRHSYMSIIIFPKQFPAPANYDSQTPYLQWDDKPQPTIAPP